MKNIDIFVHENITKLITKGSRGTYLYYDDFMKSDCFVTSLKFVQEPRIRRDSPRNISQYPLERCIRQNFMWRFRIFMKIWNIPVMRLVIWNFRLQIWKIYRNYLES